MLIIKYECKMESGSWRDCYKSGVNPATPVYEQDKPRSKLDLLNIVTAIIKKN